MHHQTEAECQKNMFSYRMSSYSSTRTDQLHKTKSKPLYMTFRRTVSIVCVGFRYGRAGTSTGTHRMLPRCCRNYFQQRRFSFFLRNLVTQEPTQNFPRCRLGDDISKDDTTFKAFEWCDSFLDPCLNVLCCCGGTSLEYNVGSW